MRTILLLLIAHLASTTRAPSAPPPSPITRETCLDRCSAATSIIQVIQDSKENIHRCASVLFRLGVESLYKHDFANAETQSWCSHALEPDHAAEWNALSASMQHAAKRRDAKSLIKHAKHALLLEKTTSKELAEVQYFVGAALARIGTRNATESAQTYLEAAAKLSPLSPMMAHSLATFHHRHNTTLSHHRFAFAQQVAAQAACSPLPGRVVRGGSFSFDSNNNVEMVRKGETDEKLIFEVHENVVIFGESVTLRKQQEIDCTFLLPSSSFALASIDAARQKLVPVSSKKDNVREKESMVVQLADAGLAVPFAPRNFYMTMVDALPRAYHLITTGVSTMLIPTPTSAAIREVFQTLLLFSLDNGGSSKMTRRLVEYDPKKTYYVTALHTVDWPLATSAAAAVDQPPRFVLRRLLLGLRAAGVLPMPSMRSSVAASRGRRRRRNVQGDILEEENHHHRRLRLMYMEREDHDGRVLSPRLSASDLMRMMRRKKEKNFPQPHQKNQWTVDIHRSGSHSRRTMKELVASFQDVDIVVGMHGAGLANLLFCTSSTFSSEIRSVVLVEMTPFDRSLLDDRGYDHYARLIESLDRSTLRFFRLVAGVWETPQFAAPTVARTKRSDTLLSQVLSLAQLLIASNSVTTTSSAPSRLTSIAKRAQTMGTEHHAEKRWNEALSMYQNARELQSAGGRLAPPMRVSIQNTASIAYDQGFVGVAVTMMESLHPTEIGPALYALELMKRQQRYVREMERDQEDGVERREVAAKPVPTFEYGELSYFEFVDEYWSKHIPVVFRHAKQYLVQESVMWKSEESLIATIAQECGASQVEELIHVYGSKEWAGLEPRGTTTLFNFLQGAKSAIASRSTSANASTPPPSYVVDFSIGRTCPSLLHKMKFHMSRYVRDKLQQLRKSRSSAHGVQEEDELSKFVDHWPSLFVGEKGTVSGLHVDSIGHFWQLVLSGKKKWTIFNSNDRHHLSPDALRRTFMKQNESEQRFVPRWEHVMEPGDFILVPSNSPHQVFNIHGGVAMAGNFIDGQSMSDVIEELKLGQTGGAPGYDALFKALEMYQEEVEEIVGDKQEEDLSWNEYKRYSDYEY